MARRLLFWDQRNPPGARQTNGLFHARTFEGGQFMSATVACPARESRLPLPCRQARLLHPIRVTNDTWRGCIQVRLSEALVGLEAECRRLASQIGGRLGFAAEELEDLGRDFYVHLVDSDLRRLRSYPGHGNFSAWLTRCCAHFLIDLRRYRETRFLEVPLTPEHESTELAESDGIELRALRNLERERNEARVASALGLLSRAEKTLLALHYLAGLSHPEIATHFGTSPVAIRQRCSRAIRRLRASLLGSG